jgi:hypothetical protein
MVPRPKIRLKSPKRPPPVLRGWCVRGDGGECASARAAAGLAPGSIRTSQSSAVFKSCLEWCMADRGYAALGWN